MLSFQERMKTFDSWPESYGVATPESLSIAGFICISTARNNLTVRCVYCDKTLESWEDTDLPVKEHYLHMTKCPLFNVNQIGSRMATFKNWSGDAKSLARNGFVKYNLGSSDFIFCYICGSTDRTHGCKRIPGSTYSIEKDSDIFFYRLLEGVYNKEVLKSLEVNVYIPKQLKEQVKLLVGNAPKNGMLMSTEDVIKEYIDNQIAGIEKVLDGDVQKTLSEVFGATSKRYMSTKDVC